MEKRDELSWIDLPTDDYTAILGYGGRRAEQLDQLVKAYHQLPKDEEQTLSQRITALDEVALFIEGWIAGGLGEEEKKKHLLFIADIAVKKSCYLRALVEVYALNLFTDQAQEAYHYDQSRLKNSSRKVVTLTNVHWFSLKQRYYWGDFWTDSLDPCHRVLTPFYDQWKALTQRDGDKVPHFFLWLETQHLPIYVPRVHYFNDAERERARVVIHEGHFALRGELGLQMVDTTDVHRMIFVIDLDEEIYLAPEQVAEQGKVQHSSFTRGKPVLGAGVIELAQGAITSLALESGHYLPGVEIGYQILTIFREKGAELGEFSLFSFYDRDKYETRLNEELLVDYATYEKAIDDSIETTKSLKKELAI